MSNNTDRGKTNPENVSSTNIRNYTKNNKEKLWTFLHIKFNNLEKIEKFLKTKNFKNSPNTN